MSHNDSNHPAPIPALLTSRELAALLGCSDRHVYMMRKRGLPAIRLGALVRFDAGQVRRWIDGNGGDLDDERARQFNDIAASGDEDNAECATADLAREFPDWTP